MDTFKVVRGGIVLRTFRSEAKAHAYANRHGGNVVDVALDYTAPSRNYERSVAQTVKPKASRYTTLAPMGVTANPVTRTKSDVKRNPFKPDDWCPVCATTHKVTSC